MAYLCHGLVHEAISRIWIAMIVTILLLANASVTQASSKKVSKTTNPKRGNQTREPCRLVSEGSWNDGDWIVEFENGSKAWSNETDRGSWKAGSSIGRRRRIVTNKKMKQAERANPRAISWESHSGCQIEAIFEEAFAGRRTVFMGDSQMSNLFFTLMNHMLAGAKTKGWECRPTRRMDISVSSKRSAATWWDYLKLKRPDQAQQPAPENFPGCEPTGDGKTGCTTCMPEKIVCTLTSTTKATYRDAFFEFLPVEFALDSEVTVGNTRTTQETIFDVYFAGKNGPDSIVASAGHHDMFLWGHKNQQYCRAGTLDRYDASTKQYARLMARYAEKRRSEKRAEVRMIWLTMSQVMNKFQPEKWVEASDNVLIRSMNKVAIPHFEAAGVHVLDVRPIAENLYSQSMLHNEAIHIKGQGLIYYKQIGLGITHDLAIMGKKKA